MPEPAYPNTLVTFVREDGQTIRLWTGNTGTIEISLEVLALLLKDLGFEREN